MIGKAIALFFLLLSLFLVYPVLSMLAERGADGRMLLAASAIYLVLAFLLIAMIVCEMRSWDGGGWDGEELD